jgi:hypothetical protein
LAGREIPRDFGGPCGTGRLALRCNRRPRPTCGRAWSWRRPATDDPVHGQQEGRSFHGSYDPHRLPPLYVFRGGELLAAYLRLPPPQQYRRGQAQPGPPEAAGAAAPSRPGRGADHDPGRQRVLPLAADAVVRLARPRPRPGVGQEPGPGTPGAGRDRACRAGVSSHRAAAADLRLLLVRGGELGPRVAGDRQGRAPGPGGDPAVRDGQRAGRPAGAPRGCVLPEGRDGEPDQGAAAGPVRRPDELPPVPGRSIPIAAELGGVRAGAGVGSDGAGGDGAGAGSGGDDPVEAVPGGGAGGGDGASGGVSAGEQLPVSGGCDPLPASLDFVC